MKKEKSAIDVMIGDELRELRLSKGLTLEEVGLRMGMGRQAICEYEKGRVSVSITKFIKLCDIYGVKYYDVLEKVKKYAYKV